METTVCRTTTNIRRTHQRSQRKSFSTEAKSIKLKLDPLFACQIKSKKHKLVLNSKIKLKLKPSNFTKFLTAKKKLELTINDNSTSTAIETTGMKTPTVLSKFTLTNDKKSRNADKRRRLLLDSSYFNTSDSNTPTNKNNFFYKPHNPIGIHKRTLRALKANINRTTISLNDNSTSKIKSINEKCLNITENSELIRNTILNFPLQEQMTFSSSFRRQLEHLDEIYHKKSEQKKRNEEIFNDVIDEKDKKNKEYNELQLLNMRSKTMRILQELDCIEKVTPYVAFREHDSIKRIFSIRGNRYMNDVAKSESVPKKNTSIIIKKKEFNAKTLMRQTNKLLRLVNKSYSLKKKLTEQLIKCQSSKNYGNDNYFV